MPRQPSGNDQDRYGPVLQFRVAIEEYAKLRAVAEKQQCSVAAVARQILSAGLAKQR